MAAMFTWIAHSPRACAPRIPGNKPPAIRSSCRWLACAFWGKNSDCVPGAMRGRRAAAVKKSAPRFVLPGCSPGLANRRGEEPQSQEDSLSRATTTLADLSAARSLTSSASSGPIMRILRQESMRKVLSGSRGKGFSLKPLIEICYECIDNRKTRTYHTL